METTSFPDTPHAHLLPSSEEMRGYDAATIASGIKSLELMERAGEALYHKLRQTLLIDNVRTTRVVVLCGPGNNGGDGLVVARFLKRSGVSVHAVLALSESYSPELAANAEKFLSFGGELCGYPQVGKIDLPIKPLDRGTLEELLGRSHIVVDALLGIGQREAPKRFVKELVEVLNEATTTHSLKVFSVDVPTGIDATSGEVFEPHVNADVTVSIELHKRGVLQFPAHASSKRLDCVSIGIIPKLPTQFSVLRASHDITIPARNTSYHKGSYGSVFVIGGAGEMPGAPVLSAHAALRCGAGLVTMTRLGGTLSVTTPPEVTLRILEGASEFSREHVEQLSSTIARASALVIGPGLSLSPSTGGFIHRLLPEVLKHTKPFVLDADGLNSIAPLSASNLPRLDGGVLTPHPGEMARLLGKTIPEIEHDRYSAALTLAELTGSVVILKGPATIIANSDGGLVNHSTTPYLATAGSGDVLAGIIASLLAQKLSPFKAAATGVYLHSEAGKCALESRGGPIIATDIIEALPKVIGVRYET